MLELIDGYICDGKILASNVECELLTLDPETTLNNIDSMHSMRVERSQTV